MVFSAAPHFCWSGCNRILQRRSNENIALACSPGWGQEMTAIKIRAVFKTTGEQGELEHENLVQARISSLFLVYCPQGSVTYSLPWFLSLPVSETYMPLWPCSSITLILNRSFPHVGPAYISLIFFLPFLRSSSTVSACSPDPSSWGQDRCTSPPASHRFPRKCPQVSSCFSLPLPPSVQPYFWLSLLQRYWPSAFTFNVCIYELHCGYRKNISHRFFWLLFTASICKL